MSEPEQQDRRADPLAVADRLVAHAAKLPEPQMRRVYFCERLTALDDDLAIDVLEAVLARAQERRADAVGLLADLGEADAFFELLGPEKRSRIYHGARRRERADVVRLLSRPRAKKGFGDADDEASQYAVKDRTLGERRWLARGRDRDVLDRLTYDLDPLVIRELLGNPMVTEKHVVKIAARRPTVPEVLAEVARHRRWSTNRTVREAIVRNPYVDPHLALSLVPTMLLDQLREIASDMEVHEEVRQQARLTLARRRAMREK